LTMLRSDGRALDKMRRVVIERDCSEFAEGSALMQVGRTKVLCTATVEERVPQFVFGTGRGWVTAEYGMIPRSCPQRVERSAVRGRNQEIQRLVGRSLRAVVDLKELGERTIILDCDVLQADGGTRTASVTGAYVALVDALASLRLAGVIKRWPVRDYLAAVSVGLVDKHPFLDLAYEEDARAQVDMNVVATGSGAFVEIQGTGEGRPFSEEELQSLLGLARKGISELIELEHKLLDDLLGQVRELG